MNALVAPVSAFGSLWRSAPVSAKVGIVIVFLWIFIGLFAGVIAPYGETEVVGSVWQEWSAETMLGTDQLGRDLLTRIIYGARNTIFIALLTTVLSFFIGITSGFMAAALGGWTDQLLSRIVDILLSIPILIFSLMLLSVLGTSVPVLIIVLAMLDSTRVFRLARSVSMDIVVMDYVEVARLRGEKLWWIMRREILPNAVAPLIAEFGLRFCFVFLLISALSFLGLGLQPPTADWGSMVRENAGAISFGILTPLIPALAIASLTIGVNLVVDWMLHKTSGLRDEV
ncbi:MAG: ABC transporter permease [Hyphomicrobiales bacterium]|nr:ABC transporter permease [Hyphomicrobiales bacterium]